MWLAYKSCHPTDLNSGWVLPILSFPMKQEIFPGLLLFFSFNCSASSKIFSIEGNLWVWLSDKEFDIFRLADWMDMYLVVFKSNPDEPASITTLRFESQFTSTQLINLSNTQIVPHAWHWLIVPLQSALLYSTFRLASCFADSPTNITGFVEHFRYA